jgi:stringent starvation protein B
MENEFINRQKRKRLEVMLGAGIVMVHLDPRRAGVGVPERFSDDPVLRLNLAYGFNLPRFDIDNDGVFAVLSFDGVNFGCALPWESIFAMTTPDDPKGAVWPDSVPSELVTEQPVRLRVVEG